MKLNLLPIAHRRRSLALLAALLAVIASWLLLQNRATAPAGNPSRARLDVRKEAGDAGTTPQNITKESGTAPVNQQVADIFAVRNWEPPQPAMDSAAAQNLPPQAPPLPFRFLGRIVEPGKGAAFLLTQGDRILSVRVGNSIDGTYQVDKYEGGQLYFLYRPMKIRQSLPIGGES